MGRNNDWTPATYQKFNALRAHVEAFSREPSFEGLSEEGLSDFVVFLRERRNLMNSTIGKQLGLLKWFLRWASAKGYNTNMAFQSFSPKLKQAVRKVVFLDWDELMRVYNYDIPADGTVVELTDAGGAKYCKTVHASDGMTRARDMFLLSCFTSLRYSDVSNLKRSDIKNGVLTVTTVKTSDTISIELNKYARAILDRYADDTTLKGYALPYITNQKMNMYLKELMELCGINELVTQTYYRGSQRIDETRPKFELIGTHTGRRTFICNALMLGIPAEVVMKWTGHADYKSMKPYIGVTDKTKAREMDKFNDL